MSSRLTPEIMTHPTAHSCFLAGDIGATKTSLALYRSADNLLTPFAETTVNNASAANLEQIIETFLHDNTIQPDRACFGVAGPVSNNRVNMTNLEWSLDGLALQKRFGMQSVTLINDLVATAMGTVCLPSESLFCINKGHPDPVGTIGVIAPGTGLGEAFLVKHRDNWLPIPSEGGHSSFAPTDEQQRRLLDYMAKHHSHISTEIVCSGRGIPNLYDFLSAENGMNEKIDDYSGRTRIIVDEAIAALGNNEPSNIALQAIELFAAILASEAANLSLKILATGGLYIGGGIPPRILPFLQHEKFMHSFARGEYREMLTAIPIHIILEPKTALVGAAAYGLDRFSASGDR